MGDFGNFSRRRGFWSVIAESCESAPFTRRQAPRAWPSANLQNLRRLVFDLIRARGASLSALQIPPSSFHNRASVLHRPTSRRSPDQKRGGEDKGSALGRGCRRVRGPTARSIGAPLRGLDALAPCTQRVAPGSDGLRRWRKQYASHLNMRRTIRAGFNTVRIGGPARGSGVP